MKYKCIKENENTISVTAMCDVLEVSRSGYYEWKKCKTSQRRLRDEELLKEVRCTFSQSNKIYGSPRVFWDLRNRGFKVSRKRIARLMAEEGLVSRQNKRRFKPQMTDSKHDDPIADNVIQQDFEATGPNQKWGSDITYIPTDQGWMYLAVVLDFYSRRVVGWAMGANPTAALAGKALKMALICRRDTDGLIHHSDRGSTYTADSYRKMLKKLAIISSMSAKGNCYDNAMVESFFHSLKTEHVMHCHYQTGEQATDSIKKYIEQFYNTTRLHSSLDYRTPMEYERMTA